METKYCNYCHKEHPINEFGKKAQSADGLDGTCKKARTIMNKERRLRHRAAYEILKREGRVHEVNTLAEDWYQIQEAKKRGR